MRKTYTHIELLDRFMSGKTSPEEERTLLAWFSDSDHKEEIMAFYMSRWEESSGKKLPPKLQGQMFCEIKKRIRQEKKTLEIKKKPHTLWKWLSYAAVAARFMAVNANALDDYGGKTNIAFCQACGKAFIKRGNRQKYCGTLECQSVRNKLKSKEYYYREKAKGKTK